MAPIDRELLTELLHACFDAAPEPLYPGRFAEAHGIDRAVLDRALDELRLKGLIRLTEWVQGVGQGYTLTQAGMDLLENPRGLRPGVPLPAARLPVPEPYPDEEAARLSANPPLPAHCELDPDRDQCGRLHSHGRPVEPVA